MGLLKRFGLSFEGWQKVAKGALIAGAGAALVYVSQHFGEIDFGALAAPAAAVASVVINYLLKVLEASSDA